jgi:hypothetical protein
MSATRSKATPVAAAALLVLIATAWPAGQVAQGPQPQGPPPSGTAFLAGQVVDVPAGRPVAQAIVTLSGRMAGPTPRTLTQGPITTDAQGRFAFGSLPAGTYSVQASRAGYILWQAMPVVLDEDSRVLDVRPRLIQQASISGTLRDENGDPVVGTSVIAFRSFTYNGRPSLQPSQPARSDDRGVYRFGAIAPGDYVVCACGRDPIPFDGLLLTTLASEPVQLINVAARALAMGSDAVSLDATLRTYPPTLYPNSQSLSRATRFTLAPGEERSGIDITLDLVRATRVSGRVLGAPGPVVAGGLRLVPAVDADAGYELLSLPPMLVQPDGRFDFTSVPPGQYRFMATATSTGGRGGWAGPSGAALNFLGGRGAMPPPPPTPASTGVAPQGQANQWMWASEVVNVGEDGVSGLVVTMRQALPVTGRMEFEGSAPRPTVQATGRIAFLFEPLTPDRGALGVTLVQLSPDFRLAAVPGVTPGRYIINFGGISPYTMVKSVTVGSSDVTDLPIEVGDGGLGELVITLTDAPAASVAVTLSSATGTPRAQDDLSVMVFPANKRYWVDPAAAARRFRQTAAALAGPTTVPNLPAGEYFVAVGSTSQDAVGWQEQARIEALSRRAQRVTLTEGVRATVEIRR